VVDGIVGNVNALRLYIFFLFLFGKYLYVCVYTEKRSKPNKPIGEMQAYRRSKCVCFLGEGEAIITGE